MCPHTRFNTTKSSTFSTLSQRLSIEYGIGSAQGVYGMDTVTVGTTILPNQTIGLVSNTNNILSPANSSLNSNGILGLGYPHLSMKSGEKPRHFVMGLYESKVIAQPIFSIFLNSHLVYGNSGEVILGGVDKTKYQGEIQYAPVVSFDVSKYIVAPNLDTNSTRANGSYLYWAIPGQGVSTSTGYKSASTQLNAYILDTGTTLTYVPAKLAQDIVMSITKGAKSTVLDQVNGIYQVDCNTAVKYKNASVQFMISTSTVTSSTTPIVLNVPLSELVLPMDEDALTASASKTCMFGIAPAPAGLQLTSGETWLLGESVLRSLYTVYDLEKNQVGLAALSSTNTTAPTTPPSGNNKNNTTANDQNQSSFTTSYANALVVPLSAPFVALVSCIMLYHF